MDPPNPSARLVWAMTRRDARRRALDILYQADVSGTTPSATLAQWLEEGTEEDVPLFARELVLGVERYLREIDELISRHAEGWTVARMPVVDRTILRLACHELLHRPDVPVAVAISEAVTAAKELSTEASGRYVNGILGRIAREELPDRFPNP
jgi:transcription antitermination protein NusB